VRNLVALKRGAQTTCVFKIRVLRRIFGSKGSERRLEKTA
jgi:hypothetical protein